MNPVDTYIVYKFIKKLVTPFNQMPAFHLGLIDEKGNFLRPRKDFSQEDKSALTLFDVMIINLKRLIAKIPGGGSRIGTIAAAMLLLRSNPKKLKEETLVNDLFELEENFYKLYEEIADLYEDAPPINVTTGIAGLTPDSLKIPEKARKKYKEKNAADMIKFIRRKALNA